MWGAADPQSCLLSSTYKNCYKLLTTANAEESLETGPGAQAPSPASSQAQSELCFHFNIPTRKQGWVSSESPPISAWSCRQKSSEELCEGREGDCQVDRPTDNLYFSRQAY